MIHIYVKNVNEYDIDLYYSAEDVKVIKVTTDKFNMKTIWLNGSPLYENVLDVVVENI